MKLSAEQERERLKRWMASGEVYDPRNEDDFARKLRNSADYDDWNVGMEPLPGDRSWAKKKPLKGA